MRGSMLFFVLSFAAAVTGPLDRKVVTPVGMSSAGLPFSLAIASGDFLYLAGNMGTEPGTTNITGDIKAQTRKTLQNLGAVLKAEGLDYSNVVSANVYVTDPGNFAAMNEVYREFFPKDQPTRATIEAKLVLPGGLVEISMVAARKGVERKVIRPEGWMLPASPYSSGILVGTTLFVSGTVSRDSKTNQNVGGDIKTQTTRVLDNIGAILKAGGMDYKDVVTSRVFLADVQDFQFMNDVYRTYFTEAPPARATVKAGLMGADLKVEIQCVAVKSSARKVVSADGAPRSASPLSPAIQAGDRLFLSGMLGRGDKGYEPDVKAQTRKTLENLKATLQASGMDFGNVVDAVVYLTDVSSFSAMNEVYREMLPQAPPARATIGVGLVAPEGLVEIMMTAAK